MLSVSEVFVLDKVKAAYEIAIDDQLRKCGANINHDVPIEIIINGDIPRIIYLWIQKHYAQPIDGFYWDVVRAIKLPQDTTTRLKFYWRVA